MPRITIISPIGMNWQIATRQTETLLKAWFDEILPWTHIPGRPGIDDFDTLWPRITIWPMCAWKTGMPSDPDWLTDNRVLGRHEEFPARNGDEGLAELLRLRRRLEQELADIKRGIW